MTSRVQKGGPIFRPVAKARSRPAESRATPAPSKEPSAPTRSPTRSSSQFDEQGLPSQPSTIFTSSDSYSHHEDLFPPIDFDAVSLLTSAEPTINERSQITAVNPSPSFVPSLSPPSLRASIRPPSLSNSATPVSIPLPSRSQSRFHESGALTPLPSSAAQLPPDQVPLPSSHSSTSPVALNARSSSGNVITPPIVVGAIAESQLAGPSSETQSPVETKSKGKRKRPVAGQPDGDVDEGGESTPKKPRKRRSTSGTPRPRKSRAPSMPSYDADADPGEDIDPTTITMATLCMDTGQGRVSSKAAEIQTNHAAWKLQSKEKRARMRAVMDLKKYGREDDADAPEGTNTGDAQEIPGPVAQEPSTLDNTEEGSSTFDYTQHLATSRFNVQVRIGPNGETLIDEDSLVVDRNEADEKETDNYTHIVESDHTKFVNSGSYGKRFRGSRWSAEETEQFYHALSQYGENYELIAYVLPGRDRKSCKNKFKAEDKKNHSRIDYCLSNSVPVDMQTLSRMTGKDFSGPVPEIRTATPQPTKLSETPALEKIPPNPSIKKRSRGKKVESADVEIVGNATDYVDGP